MQCCGLKFIPTDIWSASRKKNKKEKYNKNNMNLQAKKK